MYKTAVFLRENRLFVQNGRLAGEWQICHHRGMQSKEISSLQHPKVKHLVKLRENRRYREEMQSALLAGKKLVTESVQRQKIQTLLVEIHHPVPSDLSAEEILLVTPEILKKVTGLENPEPLAAEVALPKQQTLQGKRYLLALDGVADPGNLGTLLRTALALGWEGAFILEGCADPFNEKAIRAAKGATFRIPLRSGNWQELQHLIKENQMSSYVAEIAGESLESAQIAKPPLLLILGNEAHGVSPEAKQAGRSLTIPMSGEMESLNVAAAGAILMYTLKERA